MSSVAYVRVWLTTQQPRVLLRLETATGIRCMASMLLFSVWKLFILKIKGYILRNIFSKIKKFTQDKLK